jgi:hypothetical protein
METAADELEQLAGWAVRARAVAEQQRRVLGRYALVWWNGAAADRYWQHVEERRADLALCAEGLGTLADTATVLARLVRAEERLVRDLGVTA